MLCAFTLLAPCLLLSLFLAPLFYMLVFLKLLLFLLFVYLWFYLLIFLITCVLVRRNVLYHFFLKVPLLFCSVHLSFTFGPFLLFLACRLFVPSPTVKRYSLLFHCVNFAAKTSLSFTLLCCCLAFMLIPSFVDLFSLFFFFFCFPTL